MLTAQCGTRSGYRKHLRLKEFPCADCKKANTEYSKKWQSTNPEQNKKHREQYRKQSKEKISEYQKNWYQTNKDRLLRQSKNYYENNKEKSFAKARRRKAKLKNLQTEVYTVNQIIDLYGNICHICQKEIDLSLSRKAGNPEWERSLHLDHVIPISKGGTDTVDNVKPAHAVCNLIKGATMLEGFVC